MMTSEENKKEIITFFENIDKYYGSKTEITEGLTNNIEELGSKYCTWNLSEFNLIRSAYRDEGAKFMLEGVNMYYELAGDLIISLKVLGRNKFEFIEQYGLTVFRITRIRFHYKY